jgi:hypothetical protein
VCVCEEEGKAKTKMRSEVGGGGLLTVCAFENENEKCAQFSVEEAGFTAHSNVRQTPKKEKETHKNGARPTRHVPHYPLTLHVDHQLRREPL